MRFEASLDDALTAAMRKHAEACYPNEACGLILGDGKKAEFVAAENVSQEPRGQFLIDHETYRRAVDSGRLLAIWHSHPDSSGEPSELDRAGCEATALPWLISGIRHTSAGFEHDRPQLVEPTGQVTDYVGRPYVFGTFDCYTLMVDFYRREFGIELPRFSEFRIEKWWTRGYNILEDLWPQADLVPVTDGTFEHGDVLFIAMGGEVPNHVAIYVTGDIILHHLVNRLSRRETFGPNWLSMVKLHLRHKSKC